MWMVGAMICKECRLRNGTTCLISKRVVPDLNHAACPWGRREDTIRTCDWCGGRFEDVIIDFSSNEVRFICSDCFRKLGSCFSCVRSNTCAFKEDKCSPDVVMRTIQQNGMFLQTQVLNPDKIAVHCTKCECWNTRDKYCMKEQGLCERYRDAEK